MLEGTVTAEGSRQDRGRMKTCCKEPAIGTNRLVLILAIMASETLAQTSSGNWIPSNRDSHPLH